MTQNELIHKSNGKALWYTQYLSYAILLALCFFILFLKIDTFHMRWWDESMFAVNSYEMIQSGNFIAPTFDQHYDYFNTKPPLTNWIQIIFIKLFGYTELAIRLPSAIAALVILLILFRFVRKFGNNSLGWISVLVLLTSEGFVGYHSARTGDSDMLLTLFLLLASLQIVLFVLTGKGRYRWTFFIFFTFAFATKSFAAFLFVPGIILGLVLLKKFKSFVMNFRFALGVLGFLVLIGFIFGMREYYMPGYLEATFKSDAGRIVLSSSYFEKHKLFYLDQFSTGRFSLWFLPALLGVLMIFRKGSNDFVDVIMKFFSAIVITYLFIISVVPVKLMWYDVPIYPLMAVLASYPLFYLLRKLQILSEEKQLLNFFVLLTIFALPYYQQLRNSQRNEIGAGEQYQEANSMFIHEKLREGMNFDKVKVLHHGWQGSLLFYKYHLKEKEQHIEIIKFVDDIEIGDRILSSNDSLKRDLDSKWKFDVISVQGHAELVEVKEKKQNLTSTH